MVVAGDGSARRRDPGLFWSRAPARRSNQENGVLMTPKRSFEDALTQPNEPLIAGEGPGEWRWRLRPADPEECRHLAERLRIHPVTARILAARGWSTPALAAGFLNPGWGDILDPTHLPDFDRAIGRIIHAIRHGEGIMVIGDYDVDGVTATAILSTAIQLAGGAVTWRIPHRVLDGYGMRDKHVEAAKQEGVRLIVTADTGTRSFSAVHCANSAAIDVVITDHHLPESRLPEAVAVVNPTRTTRNTPTGASAALASLSRLQRVSSGLCTCPKRGRWLSYGHSSNWPPSERLPTWFRSSVRTAHWCRSVCVR